MLVVNYRTPALTLACVESVLASTGVDVAVMVIDNASGDDSVDRLRARFGSEPRVALHARTVNDGYTGGNNAGFALAREHGARWAFVLNSDAEIAPDCLALLVAEAERDERVALVSPRIFFGDARETLWFGGGRHSRWLARPVHVGLRREASRGWTTLRDLPFATGCALLVRLAALGRDGFDASLFAYAEDLDLSLRLRGAGYRIRYVPEAHVWHHEGSSHRSSSGQSLRWYLNTRNLLRVNARHARWYHWPALGPMLLVNVVGRFVAVALRDRDWKALGAVLRGARDAFAANSSRDSR